VHYFLRNDFFDSLKQTPAERRVSQSVEKVLAIS